MILRFAAATGLVALALAACGKKDDAQPGAAPPKAVGPVLLAEGDMPQPSPGLWETKVTSGYDAGTVSRICYDAAFAKQMGLIGQRANTTMNCQRTVTRQADASLVSTSSCTGPDGKALVSRSVIRGDFRKAYTTETDKIFMIGSTDPDGEGPQVVQTTRIGDCPAGYRPGDMEVGGVRMNMADILGGAQTPAP